MVTWPRMRSRWLDIGKFLFGVFMDRDGVEVLKHVKDNVVRPSLVGSSYVFTSDV